MPRQGLGHSSVDIYNMVTPGTDDPVWKHPGAGQLMMGYQQTRSNFVLFSQDTTDAEAWTKGNTAIDSTLYEAPDNSTTANAIKSNSTGEKVYNINQDLSVTAGKTYTLSVHIKKENLGFAQLRFSDDDGLPRAQFNLTTGAITNVNNTISTQVDAMDDGWYRCSITFVATTSSGRAMVMAQSAAGDGTPNIAVSGIVLLYVWGWQLEENSEMSAYIVTTNSARTTTETLNDTSETWDFDSADLMPEADPDDDGVWEVPANIVLNGDYEELGGDLVTNGGFDADSDWSKGTNWTISGGSATSDGTDATSNLFQSITSFSGKSFLVEGSASNVTQGYFFVSLGGSDTQIVVNSNGSFKHYVNISSGSSNFFLSARDNFIGSIDNVSVKQVDPNDRWTLGDGWSISDGKAVSAGDSTHSSCTQTLSLPAGQYEVSLNATVTSGSFSIQAQGSGTDTGAVINSSGAHTEIFTTTANRSTFSIRSNDGNGVGSIDNVTVNEYAITPLDV